MFLGFLPTIIGIVIMVAAWGYILRILSGKHPIFSIIEKRVAEFKSKTFVSEDEKIRAKEQFKSELISWKASMELKKQSILLRSSISGLFLKKNIRLIDAIQEKLQEEINALS